MAAHREQGCPRGKIDMICPSDVHRDTHSGSMSDIRVVSRARLYEEGGANGLLATIILDDPLLYPFLYVQAEGLENRQIHARVHQPKGIPSRGYAVKGWQRFERT